MQERAIRAFISYSHKERQYAAQIRDALDELGVASFLAHDDLKVSEEWRERIIEELQDMDVFVPVLSAAFKGSDWAPQELGFAVSRSSVRVVPLSLDGTVPFGFIAHLQGKRLPEKPDPSLFVDPLMKSFPARMRSALIRRLGASGSFRGAEARFQALVPYMPEFTDRDVDQLVDASIANNQIWDAGLCKGRYLPDFIEMHRSRIRPEKLEQLQELISQ